MVYDVAVVGGGIVGLATAYQLSEHHPDRRIIVLEKEDRIATHQSSRNSGVIHSGIYYTPGSLKAKNCRDGRQALVRFCRQHDISHEMCGKVIVAVTELERERLGTILDRGKQNGIECEWIGPGRLREMEPHVEGIEAVYVPDAGIVDFTGVAACMARLIEDRGGEVRTGAEMIGFSRDCDHVVVETTSGDIRAQYFVNCAGLYADRVTRMTGHEPGVQVVPFRGEYFELAPGARHLCRNLIYPVPDPAYPFLGVHFTRMHDGRVECGPSAIIGFAREGYSFGTVNLREMVEIIRYRGFRRLSYQHWRKGILEIRLSLSKRYYLKTLQRLVPEVTKGDLLPAPSGVRAQAVKSDGTMVDDFLVLEADRVVNVCNAASPAATASLNVGRFVASRIAAQFE
jgi:L-2-hydroxyglutarate oxidase